MPLINEDQLIQSLDASNNTDLTQIKGTESNPAGFFEAVKAFVETGPTAAILDAGLPRNDIEPTSNSLFTMKPPKEHLNHIGDAFDRTRENPEYDWWSQIKGTPYESQWKQFQYSDSDSSFNYNMSVAQKNLNLQDKISRSSGTQAFFAGLAGGAVDPINLVPAVGFLKAASLTSNIARGFAAGAVSGAGIGLASETTLTALQSSHDFSIEGVAASSALMGVLGAGGQALSGAIASSTVRNTMSNILKDRPHETLTPESETFRSAYGDSAGAMRYSLGDTRLAGFGKLAAKDTSPNITIDDLVHGYANRNTLGQVWKTPKYDALTSDSSTVRNLGELTFETSDLLTKNFEGTPNAMAWESAYYGKPMSDISNVNQAYDKLFLDLNNSSNQVAAGVKARFGSGVKDAEIRLELARAMRNGDAHENSAIAATTKQYRQILDYWKNEARKSGVMEDELHLTEGKTYLPQVWNTDKIRGNINGFKQWMAKQFIRGETNTQRIKIEAAVRHLEERLQELEAAAKGGKGLHNKQTAQAERLFNIIQDLKNNAGTDPENAVVIADDVTDHILSQSNYEQALSHVDMLSSAPAKVAKKRALAFIDDTEAEPWLINDAPALVAMHVQQLGRAITFKKHILDPMGVDRPHEILSKIKTEYQEKIDAVPEGRSTKKLEAQKEAAIKSATSILQISSGQYRTPLAIDSAMEGLRAFNVFTKMGWIVWSSLNDLLGPILVNGLPTHIVRGVIPAIASSFSSAARKVSRRQLTDYSIALDVVSRDAVRMMLDSAGDAVLRPTNGLDKAIAGTNQVFNIVTLNGAWTNFARKAAMYTEQFVLIRDLQAVVSGTATKKVLRDVARRGISEEFTQRILANINKWGEDLGMGRIDAHVGNWTDQEAADVLRQAVLKEVNRDANTSSVGTTPYWAQKLSVGNNMNQFLGFSHAATSKILMTAISRRDAAVAHYMVAAIGMGMFQYVTRMAMQGRDIDYSPTNMLLEGINRSGVFGIITNPIFAFMIPLITGHSMGTSRYFKQKPLEYLFGPSASTVEDLFDIGQNMAANGGTLSDVYKKKATKFIPLNNVMSFQLLLKQVYGDQSK